MIFDVAIRDFKVPLAESFAGSRSHALRRALGLNPKA